MMLLSVSCVCGLSEDDLMMLLSECRVFVYILLSEYHVFEYEVRMM